MHTILAVLKIIQWKDSFLFCLIYYALLLFVCNLCLLVRANTRCELCVTNSKPKVVGNKKAATFLHIGVVKCLKLDLNEYLPRRRSKTKLEA